MKQTIYQWNKQSVNRSTNQSNSLSIHQSFNRSINQAIFQTINYLTNQANKQSNKQSINQSHKPLFMQPFNQLTNQSTTIEGLGGCGMGEEGTCGVRSKSRLPGSRLPGFQASGFQVRRFVLSYIKFEQCLYELPNRVLKASWHSKPTLDANNQFTQFAFGPFWRPQGS